MEYFNNQYKSTNMYSYDELNHIVAESKNYPYLNEYRSYVEDHLSKYSSEYCLNEILYEINRLNYNFQTLDDIGNFLFELHKKLPCNLTYMPVKMINTYQTRIQNRLTAFEKIYSLLTIEKRIEVSSIKFYLLKCIDTIKLPDFSTWY